MSKIQFIIGDGQPSTPLDGTNCYTNQDLISNSFSFYINGKGFMFEGKDYTLDYMGTVKFIGATLFNTDEQITILINN